MRSLPCVLKCNSLKANSLWVNLRNLPRTTVLPQYNCITSIYVISCPGNYPSTKKYVPIVCILDECQLYVPGWPRLGWSSWQSAIRRKPLQPRSQLESFTGSWAMDQGWSMPLTTCQSINWIPGMTKPRVLMVCPLCLEALTFLYDIRRISVLANAGLSRSPFSLLHRLLEDQEVICGTNLQCRSKICYKFGQHYLCTQSPLTSVLRQMRCIEICWLLFL